MRFLSVSLVLSFFLCTGVIAQTTGKIYRFSSDIEDGLNKDTVPWKYQLGAADYAIVGQYKKALETWDKNGVGMQKISEEDSLYFRKFSPVKAKDYIISRSKNEQVIIINEAHYNARHRTFVHSLLQGLYDNGYRYLGIEALLDADINVRRFPVIESGYYTREPEFGNLISAALHIGFTLFGYEALNGENGKEREMAQAENIANFIKQHPGSKFLIYCGHDHVIEGTPKIAAWEKAMAGRLKEYTQIDPFTIDQIQFSEKGYEKFNHPYIGMANENDPVVMVDDQMLLFNGSKNNDRVDCKIIHPETKYINGRPNWLVSCCGRKTVQIQKSKVTQSPVLVLAYRENEVEKDAVPADIVEITDVKNFPELVLLPGKYEIIIKDKSYTVVEKYDFEVK